MLILSLLLYNMADVQALLILSTQVQNIKHLPEPPLSFDCFDAYNSAVQQVDVSFHIYSFIIFLHIRLVSFRKAISLMNDL